MPQLQISNPKPNQPITAGQPLSVAGLARDKGMPEPVGIDSVTVAVDNGPLIPAELKVIPHQQLTTVSFAAVAQVASVLGPHTIAVTATNDQGLSERQIVTVFIGAAHAAKQPQDILEIRYVNPDQPKDVDALYAQAVAFGQSNPTVIIGGKFPSDDAKQEWKQVLPPDLTDTAAHEADYEETLVGATGWALNPEFSGADVPFDHPFGFDWEFMLALDQPAGDPKRYTFLLTPADQSCDEDGFSDAVEQAANLKDKGQPIPIPQGPDGLPSLLGVEIDGGLVPQQFTDAVRGGVVPGDRMAVFGRWIVDCGHQVRITRCGSPSNVDIHPGITAFRTEIHPPLLMAAARVTRGSIATGNPGGPLVTRVLFTSRPYLVGQRFTTDTDNIYDDTASDDGPFWSHFLKEVIKVHTFGSLRVEAHPKIKSKPYKGVYLARFVVRPPAPAGIDTLPGRLTVSFQFTHRSGCAVQVISTGPDSVDVLIVLNDVGYTPPKLPNRRERHWTREELAQLDPSAASGWLKVETIAAAIHALTGDVIGDAVATAILERAIATDEYDTDALRSVNILDASRAISAPANNIPSTDNQAQLASLQQEREPLASEVVSDEGDLKELQSEGQHVNKTLLAKAQAKLVADKTKLKQIDDQIAALKAAGGRGVLQNDDQPYPVFGWLEIGYLPQQVHP